MHDNHDSTRQARFCAAGLILAAALLIPPLAASTEPTSSRGFAPDQVYHVTGIDAVNDLTGNLEVTIPIGPTFKTNGSLTYAFTLSYHSNLWDYIEYTGTVGAPNPYGWGNQATPIDAFPILDFNAGLGWRLSVAGHPKRHPLSVVSHFVDQTGAEHAFNSFNTSAQVTSDLSYLRITPSSSVVIVENPDGTRERHMCLTPPCSGSFGWWDLDQKSDPFGDVLYVTRTPKPTVDGQTWIWTYHEAIGATPYPDHNTAALTEVRSHTVEYTADHRMTSGFRITKVTLASSGPGNQAEYVFGYTPASILRPFTQNVNGQATVPYGDPNNNMLLVLLTSITLPEANEGDTNGDWTFDYIIVPNQTDYPGDVQPRTSPNGQIHWMASHYSGLLEKITLPTKGMLRYKYDQRILPKEWVGAGIGPEMRRQSFVSIGVRERALLLPDGSLDGDRPWRYFGSSFNPNHFEHEFIGATLDPLGNMSVSYFSIYTDSPDNPGGVWSKFDWGLPITKEEQDGSGRYLQSRIFQCTNLTPFDSDRTTAYGAVRRLHSRYLAAGETLSCGGAVRTTYSSRDNDGGFCRGDYNTDCDQLNRRTLSTATFYNDDGNSFTETINSDYDGLGHYRSVKTGGNFYGLNPGHSATPGGDERISFIGYNPGVVFLNHAYVTLPPGKTLATLDWILNTYEMTRVTQGRNAQASPATLQAASALYHFNPETGFLDRERRLRRSVACAWNETTAHANCYDSGSLDRGDVLIQNVRTQSGTGTTVKSSYFGGDLKALPTSGDLSGPFEGAGEYMIRTDYRFGEIESRAYYNACINESLVLIAEQNTIDPHSGLVTSTQDDAGAVTTFQYDNLWRFKSIDPPGADAATEYTYTAATGKGPATVVAKVGGGALETRQYELDHLGRVVADRRDVPTADNGTLTSARFKTYLANGWKTSESTTGPEPAAASTIYADFDPFGRPRTVLHPDNAVNRIRKTTFSYLGVRGVVETTHGMALAQGHGSTAVTSRYVDRFGNLSRVIEASASQDGTVDTKYEYDVLDRLVLASTGDQKRRWGYDMRGFLVSETPPELAGRTIRYPIHDSRGNPRRKLYSRAREAALPLDVSMSYDAAERLETVIQISTGHVLKELQYFPHGSANNPPLSSGKLQWTIRNNWTPPPTAPASAPLNTPVKQEFTYDAGTGRLSKRETTAAGLTFKTQFTFDGLANLASVTYPAITGCAACAPARTVSYTYREGRLTNIPGYGSITYEANDTVNRVSHTNNTVDFYDVDTSNYMRRVSNVRTTFPSGTPWVEGELKYDGAGNISAIGTQTYAYDQVNRLVQANGGAQTFTYDVYGNLMSLGGTTLLTTSPLTNRLPSPAAGYDEAGNLISWTDPRDGSTAIRDYDPFNLISHNRGAGQGKIHYYDCSDERVAVFDYASIPGKLLETWSIRGIGDEVLRDFSRLRTLSNPNEVVPWNWRDNVYRQGALLAQVRPVGMSEEVLHVHLDHLGSIRRMSNASGAVIDAQDFQPFGQEINEQPDQNRFKFTGHERDGASTPFGEVDYMHARYYVGTLGRFLSIDPGNPTPDYPQTWNRYSYARNNPLGRVDPDGRSDVAKDNRNKYRPVIPTNSAKQRERNPSTTRKDSTSSTKSSSKNADAVSFVHALQRELANPMSSLFPGIPTEIPEPTIGPATEQEAEEAHRRYEESVDAMYEILGLEPDHEHEHVHDPNAREGSSEELWLDYERQREIRTMVRRMVRRQRIEIEEFP